MGSFAQKGHLEEIIVLGITAEGEGANRGHEDREGVEPSTSRFRCLSVMPYLRVMRGRPRTLYTSPRWRREVMSVHRRRLIASSSRALLPVEDRVARTRMLVSTTNLRAD